MALHTDLVGQRVVVRRRIRGEVGPSGGPALTDTLGILTAWSASRISVLREDGETVDISQADIVTAKPVPPRATIRSRVTADALEKICAGGWRAPAEALLGDWLLRASGGFTGRANSVLTVGNPGLPFETALRRVDDFYAAHALPTQAQVVVDSPQIDQLERAGWVRARPDQPDAIVQVASVAQAVRAHPHDVTGFDVVLSGDLTPEWMRRYSRTAEADEALVRRVLTSGDAVVFAQLGDSADAIGRAVVTGDWVGVSAVEVAPEHQGQGIATAIVANLLEWAASLGARSAYLQTLPSNDPAMALYSRFGFVTHHSYRYLRPRPE